VGNPIKSMSWHGSDNGTSRIVHREKGGNTGTVTSGRTTDGKLKGCKWWDAGSTKKG